MPKSLAAHTPTMATMTFCRHGQILRCALQASAHDGRDRGLLPGAKIGAVIFPVDAERETGFRRYANEEVAEKAAENSDVLIPFASIDPAKGKAGAREARRLVREFGIRGFKFHPTMRGILPERPQRLRPI